MEDLFDAKINDPAKIAKGFEKGFAKNFPIDLGDKVLSLGGIEYSPSSLSGDKWKDINIAKKQGKTIGKNIYAKFELKDKATGKKLDSSRLKIGVLPERSNKIKSFIVNGVSYDIPLQMRLKPGAYGRYTNDGKIEVFSNVENGYPMRNLIDPETQKAVVKIKQGTYPVYPILKLFGVPDSDIKKKLGDSVFKKNSNVDYDKTIGKLYRSLYRKPPESKEEMDKKILEYFNNTKTTPEVNKKTLGVAHSTINGNYLLDATKHGIDILKGDVPLDDRDSLQYKNIFGAEDTIEDHLNRAAKRHLFEYQIKGKAKAGKDTVKDLIPNRDISKYLEKFFSSSKLSRYADQLNPIGMLSSDKHVTLLGEGGVGSSRAVSDSARNVSDSQMGFIDPVNTPESDKVGITLALAIDTIKSGKTLKTKVINVRTGKPEYLSISDVEDKNVAFPNEFKLKNGKYIPQDKRVSIVKDNKKALVPSQDVTYMIASADGLFGIQSNYTPFKDSNQGNRLLTAGKHSTHVVSLDNPEIPLVSPTVNGKDYYKEIGNKFSIHSDMDGKVQKVTNDEIQIKDKDGHIHNIDIPNDIPLNDQSLITSKLRIKEGDSVKKGDLLADTNFTKDGIYAPGVNLVTAYMPWKGYNHEDSVVLTESGAKKLSSNHLKKISLNTGNHVITDLSMFNAYAPYSIERMRHSNYDEDGVIKKGTVVNKGDVIVASLKKTTPSASDNIIAKLRKSKVDPYKDNSIKWNHPYPGTISDINRGKSGIDVYVKTIEPFGKTDKLTGRHGNKGTASLIIPDALAPITKSGERIELILDPHSVPSRINTGQILETAAGKVAAKLKKIFRSKDFDEESNIGKVTKYSKDNNVPQYEDIFDPSTGKTIPNVNVGKQYIVKLKQMAEHKLSARGVKEPYTKNNQPIAGKGIGGMAIDPLTSNLLLSYNARNTLRDALSIKNNPNADYWRAVQNGETPPLPTVPYEWKKFNDLLKGRGINMVQKGSSVKLTPMTDKDILDISSGKIETPTRAFLGKGDDLTAVNNGMFGDVTGGIQGETFNHIELADRILNPTYRKSVKDILHMTDTQLDKLIKGETDAKTT